MAPLVDYTKPVYEAVICNLALEEMLSEEQQEKVLSTMLLSLNHSRDLLKKFREADFSTLSPGDIQRGYLALYTLVETGRQAVASIRASFPFGKYDSAFTTAAGEMEDYLERFEDICEAWSMSCDESLVADLKQALLAVTGCKNKDIPDWRSTLASITPES